MSPRVKRPKEKFVMPPKYVLLIMTVACIGLMALTFVDKFPSFAANSALGYIVTPFQKGVTFAGSFLIERTKQLSNVKDLLTENTRLKDEVEKLLEENAVLQKDKFELNNLRELYKLDNRYSDYEKVGARVIGSDGGNWFSSFIIDKGASDGIKKDMNVCSGSGLVGRVVEVGDNWARVISIIDDRSNVSATVLVTGDNLIVSGDLKLMKQGFIRFSQLLNNEKKVSIGDEVVTSNISDKYLPGLPVGYIVEMNTDSNALTYSGTVVPSVDFAHIEEVLVITTLKDVP